MVNDIYLRNFDWVTNEERPRSSAGIAYVVLKRGRTPCVDQSLVQGGDSHLWIDPEIKTTYESLV